MGEIYTVRSGKVSADWKVVPPQVNLQPLKSRRKEFLGFCDLRLREEIANSSLPLAELILQLLYKDGEWQLYLDTMNKNVQAFNNSLGRRESKKKKISLFTKKEFLIGHAILIGAADCSERGDNLWASSKDNKWKSHWLSILQPTTFGRYTRNYRFKHFKKYLPKIWQDDTQQLTRSNNNPWAKFSLVVDNDNDIRKDLLLMSEIITIDESMSAYRPQTTKEGGLPNITFVLRKPENLGTEFKTVGKCRLIFTIALFVCHSPYILFYFDFLYTSLSMSCDRCNDVLRNSNG